jgi:hypothetical protein
LPSITSIKNLILPGGVTAFLRLKAGVTRSAAPPDEYFRPRLDPRSRTDGAEAEAPPVFFVVGRGKSGTSWLMRTFDAHPEILCRGEGRFFGKDWQREDLKNEQVSVPPRTLHGALRDSEYLRMWIERSIWSRDGDVDRDIDEISRAAVEYFLKKKLAESGKRIVGDKTPLLTPETIGEIGTAYPEAKVIHIIRDGRDVTVSAVHHHWNQSKDRGGIFNIKPESAERREAYRRDPKSVLDTGMFTEKQLRGRARQWKDFVGKAAEDGRALPEGHYAEIRYEDLLEDPHGGFKRLLEFLGAASDDETVRRCVEATSFEKMSKGRKPGEEDPTSFYRKGIAGDWKNVFTERDREIFKEEAGELLVKLGYEKDAGW